MRQGAREREQAPELELLPTRDGAFVVAVDEAAEITLRLFLHSIGANFFTRFPSYPLSNR
jgi:hypothetical protein